MIFKKENYICKNNALLIGRSFVYSGIRGEGLITVINCTKEDLALMPKVVTLTIIDTQIAAVLLNKAGKTA